MGFKTALLLDVFGRHPHRALRGGHRQPQSLAPTSKGSEVEGKEDPLPALKFVDGPFRPEDLNKNATGVVTQSAALGPDSFFLSGSEEEEKGNILHGAKPG